MKFCLTPIAIAVSAILSVPVHADEISDLKAQNQLIIGRLNQLEKSASEPSSSKGNLVTITQAPGWNLIQDADTKLSLYSKIDVTAGSRSKADAKGDRQSGML